MQVCGILVPQPQMEPVAPSVEVRILNHWTSMDVPVLSIFIEAKLLLLLLLLLCHDVT